MGSAMEYLETLITDEDLPETEEEAVEMLIESHMRQKKILEESKLPPETRQMLLIEKLESLPDDARDFIEMILGTSTWEKDRKVIECSSREE